MSALRIYPIVEGEGEQYALPVLIRRFGLSKTEPEYIEVARPEVRARNQIFIRRDVLAESLDRAAIWLRDPRAVGIPGAVLLLIDRDPDTDSTCVLAPKLSGVVQQLRSDLDVICIVADCEYESWFVAAASSLAESLDITDLSLSEIEANSMIRGKKWIQERMPLRPGNRGRQSYKETVDQVKLTNKLDLALCRRNSPSFDKLCRELELRLR